MVPLAGGQPSIRHQVEEHVGVLAKREHHAPFSSDRSIPAAAMGWSTNDQAPFNIPVGRSSSWSHKKTVSVPLKWAAGRGSTGLAWSSTPPVNTTFNTVTGGGGSVASSGEGFVVSSPPPQARASPKVNRPNARVRVGNRAGSCGGIITVSWRHVYQAPAEVHNSHASEFANRLRRGSNPVPTTLRRRGLGQLDGLREPRVVGIEAGSGL